MFVFTDIVESTIWTKEGQDIYALSTSGVTELGHYTSNFSVRKDGNSGYLYTRQNSLNFLIDLEVLN